MANQVILNRSFAGGEVSPDMLSRVDDTRVQTGLAMCRNFIAKPNGPVTRRPGTVFVNSTRSNSEARLIPFVYSVDQTMVIEMGSEVLTSGTGTGIGATSISDAGAAFTSAHLGSFVECNGSIAQITAVPSGTTLTVDFWSGGTPSGTLTYVVYRGYFRFHSNGGTLAAPAAAGWLIGTPYVVGDLVTSGGVTYYCRVANTGFTPLTNQDKWFPMSTTGEYEISHPYAPRHLFEITYAQSYDVITFAHRRYYLKELSRVSATKWTHTTRTFASSVAAPTIAAFGSSTVGVQLKVTAITAPAAPCLSVVITTETTHGLLDGDVVYIAGTGVAAVNGHYWAVAVGTYYFAGTAALYKFGLRDISTGAFGTGAGTAGAGGTVEFAPPNAERTNVYKVTAIDEQGIESLPSGTQTLTNNLFAQGAINHVTWTGSDDAKRYRIYKEENGLFGLIGELDDDGGGSGSSYTFDDDNIEPDLGITPPVPDTTLNSSDHPAAVGYFEQRRCVGGTDLQAQGLWMTRSGTESDMTYHLPVQDSDRVFARIAARQSTPIRHIVPMNQLIVLTPSTEFRISPVNSDAITPTSIAARPQSYVGASYVTPLVIDGNIIFCAERGGHVREMGFQVQADSYVPGDLSLRAAHLFDGETLLDATFQKAPFPIAWFVSSNGNLLGFTYVPGENVGSWHRHDTTHGAFESVCAISEDAAEDRVYVVVRRSVNGNIVRYVERFAPFAYELDSEAVFVDSAKTFTLVASGTVSGLSHLELERVQSLSDGLVLQEQSVASGNITTPRAAGVLTVGLPIIAQVVTAPVLLQLDGYGHGRVKNLNTVYVRVVDSCSFLVGSDETNLVPSDSSAQSFTFSPLIADVEARADDVVRVNVLGEWQTEGVVVVQQLNPFPLTVVGLAVEVSVGGV